MDELQATIDKAWEERATLQPGKASARIGEAVSGVIDRLDRGELRVATKADGAWKTIEWVKKAVLLSFRLEDNRVVESGELRYFDKVDTKFASFDREQFARAGVRVVPPAVARRG